MKTAVKIGVREVKMLEVIAATQKDEVNFGNFFVESEWEGLTKLKAVNSGLSLVVRIEKTPLNEIFKMYSLGVAERIISKTTIISGSPDLIAKLAELEKVDA